ncbi:MAG: hypothetical protein R3C27_11155 [Hyphomonadaceae bacterium]
MRRFEIKFADGRTEIIEADEYLPNASVANFMREQERPSRAMKAEPGDTVKYVSTFRSINWRLIDEVRELQ